MTDTTTSSRSTARRAGTALSYVWLPLLLLASLFVVSANSTDVYFPPATEVVQTIFSGFADGELTAALGYSMFNFISGYAIAAIVGIGGGLLLGERRVLRDATRPLLNFVRALPFVALVPIFIVALGIGAAPKVALIALGCVWPILLNTTDGVRGIAASVLETSRSYRISHPLRLRRVTLMGALPQTFAGLRIALSVGIVMVVVSEMYGSADGIGFYILFSAQRFAVAETWAGTVVLAVVGFLINVVFIWVERISLSWYFRRGGA
ncbi:ABC transporter permease [Microbacterium oryzae]|uniref:ABC transporter permease n=1 Tax=Microbacterium oryzae TaxID=743009 RepID=UPI0025B0FDFC|nr:ABC transporter permease [Microbacterium oryzae]MDN3310208.1 ABC transporter permease [Microbacterium oryzae]